MITITLSYINQPHIKNGLDILYSNIDNVSKGITIRSNVGIAIAIIQLTGDDNLIEQARKEFIFSLNSSNKDIKHNIIIVSQTFS
jgi:hypothetical protein